MKKMPMPLKLLNSNIDCILDISKSTRVAPLLTQI